MTALFRDIERAGLAVRGALPADDHAPKGARAIVLLGPDEPRFWPVFTASAEYGDGAPDPMDRWSVRVIGALAQAHEGTAIFPSDGPPYAPFIGWAQAAGLAWPAPVGPLVHRDAGLFLSFRGALALPIDLPQNAPTQNPLAQSPCPSCAQPCATACPVGALSVDAPYDVVACQTHLASPQGAECRQNGCLTRRACPVARGFERLPEQSAFHMAAFMKNHPSGGAQ